ncbi:SdhB protein, substrate of the Dot/Icm system [Legionella birminghamensis]|uniref:Protein SdhB n=1 Tax=Legionella birminghamensis TaxID=28083 RepID=A0A378IKQ0_9GAMM|nr:hypothetical protein [Legionella birminghamensis]KTC75478.1 SdhB protein, substrate of the Dot/Icm system [Legionella birminghamensis]STX32704.1 protein SdhB [Legionella birminghamensis]
MITEPAPTVSLAETIKNARISLLERLQVSLSRPVSERLTPNQDGVPFTDLDDEPPQIASIKKLVNSLYYAEKAAQAQVWERIDFSSNWGIASGIAGNPVQIAYDLYHLYLALDSFNESVPELRFLLQENRDLIQPVYDNLASAVQALGLEEKYAHLDWAGGAGLLLGGGVNALHAGEKSSLQGNVISGLLNNLPGWLNAASAALNADNQQNADELKLSEEQQKAVSRVIDLVFSEKNVLKAFPAVVKALQGFKELYEKINAEGNNISEETVKAYIQWGSEGLTALISAADELERRNYLKQGTISDAIVEQAINFRAAIEARIAQSAAVKYLPEMNAPTLVKEASMGLARAFIVQGRIRALDESRIASYAELKELEFKKDKAKEFFELLARYAGKNLGDIAAEDKQALKQSYQAIQTVVAASNIELDQLIVKSLNADEAPPAEGRFAGFWRGVEKLKKADISGLMNDIHNYRHGEINLVGGLKQKVLKYYGDRENAELLKVEIINEAQTSIVEKFKGKIVPYRQILASRDVEISIDSGSAAKRRGQGLMGLHALDNLAVVLPAIIRLLEEAGEHPENIPEGKLDNLRAGYLRVQSTIHSINAELDDKITAALNSGDKTELAKVQSELNHPDFSGQIRAYKAILSGMANSERTPLPVIDKLNAVNISSINNLRGNFAAIQEMKLSGSIGKLEEYVRNKRLVNLSSLVNEKIQSPPYADDSADPKVIKQIKNLENGLYNLRTALDAFEKMSNEDSLVSKLMKLKELALQLKAAWDALNSLTPELKAQYASVSEVLSSYGGLVSPAQAQSLDGEGLEEARSNIERGVDSLFAASALVADKQQQLSNYFNLPVDMNRRFKGYSREELANPERMKKEIDGIVAGLEKFTEGAQLQGLWKSKGLLAQLKRFGEQLGELGDTANTIARAQTAELKTGLFKGVLAELSQFEDNYYLKPGVMIHPVMQKLNVFFESMLSELDMPYEDKLAVIQQAQFIDILKEETENRIAQLQDELSKTDAPQEKINIEFRIKGLEQKVSYLEELGQGYAAAYAERKAQLLDKEFERLLEGEFIPAISHLGNPLNEPFHTQYINELRNFYQQNRERLISEGKADSLSITELKAGLHHIQESRWKTFWFVESVTEIIDNHMKKLKPGENEELAEFGHKLMQDFRNGTIPIETRYQEARSLDSNKHFQEIAAKTSNGRGLLYAIITFFKSIGYVLNQSVISHKMSIKESYQQFKDDEKVRHGEALREAYLHLQERPESEPSPLPDSGQAKIDAEKTDKFRSALQHLSEVEEEVAIKPAPP